MVAESSPNIPSYENGITLVTPNVNIYEPLEAVAVSLRGPSGLSSN